MARGALSTMRRETFRLDSTHTTVHQNLVAAAAGGTRLHRVIVTSTSADDHVLRLILARTDGGQDAVLSAEVIPDGAGTNGTDQEVLLGRRILPLLLPVITTYPDVITVQLTVALAGGEYIYVTAFADDFET